MTAEKVVKNVTAVMLGVVIGIAPEVLGAPSAIALVIVAVLSMLYAIAAEMDRERREKRK